MVILFVALGGVIAGLGRMSSSSDDLGYNTMGLLDGAYNTPGGTSVVSHPVSGVALPVSSASRTLFHHTAVPSYSVMATPALSGGSYATQGLTLTSQGAMNAFGESGGSASSMGSTHTSSQSASYAMGEGSVGGNYRTGRSGSYAASTFSASTYVNSTFSPAVYATAPAALSAINNDFSTWGKTFNTPFVAASEHQTSSGSSWIAVGISPSIPRKKNSVTIDDAWMNWLENEWAEGRDNLTLEELRTLYEKMRANDAQFADTYTWEDFLEWFGYRSQDESFKWRLPIGDGVPVLLFLCVLCALYVNVQNRNRAKKRLKE